MEGYSKMKRRTQEQKLKARKLSDKALQNLRADNQDPGFNYVAALLELDKVYSQDEIAEFCRYGSKASISNVASGKSIPLHPQGELIYILYVETFGKKPPNKRLVE